MGYITTCFFMMFCLSAYGQSIKKHYVSKIEAEGVIYHLLPVSLFDDEMGEDFSYELTYTSWNDTIAMTFTYILPEPSLIDSIRYISGKNEISGKTEQIYVEPTVKKWAHRYRMADKAEKFFQLYTPSSTAEIKIYSKGQEHTYRAKKRSWRKYAPIGQKIFEMIRLRQSPWPTKQ